MMGFAKISQVSHLPRGGFFMGVSNGSVIAAHRRFLSVCSGEIIASDYGKFQSLRNFS